MHDNKVRTLNQIDFERFHLHRIKHSGIIYIHSFLFLHDSNLAHYFLTSRAMNNCCSHAKVLVDPHERIRKVTTICQLNVPATSTPFLTLPMSAVFCVYAVEFLILHLLHPSDLPGNPQSYVVGR